MVSYKLIMVVSCYPSLTFSDSLFRFKSSIVLSASLSFCKSALLDYFNVSFSCLIRISRVGGSAKIGSVFVDALNLCCSSLLTNWNR